MFLILSLGQRRYFNITTTIVFGRRFSFVFVSLNVFFLFKGEGGGKSVLGRSKGETLRCRRKSKTRFYCSWQSRLGSSQKVIHCYYSLNCFPIFSLYRGSRNL